VPVISKTQYINKLRDLGYKFQDQADRVEIWRHPTTLHRVMIRRHNKFPEADVGSQLRQCGCSEEDIKKFFSEC
jgi:hypothetical protein